jgi:fructokinase
VFAVIGEALIDLVQPEAGEVYLAKPGGGPLNIAVGLARLGHPTQLVARLSTGALSEPLRRHALANDVGLDACVETTEQTTLAFASLDGAGRASYDFYVTGTADWGWSPVELTPLPAGTRIVHTGSLATAIPPGAEALLGAVRGFHRAGGLLVSFDPNIRPTLAGELDEAVERVEAYVAASHVVKASDEDVGWLYPKRSILDVLANWVELGPELVIITRGADGCLALRPGRDVVVVPGRRTDVVDTIGAGDAFVSGLLSGLADAGATAPGGVQGLPEESVRTSLDRAILVSSLTCARAGADPPTREEYDAAALA